MGLDATASRPANRQTGGVQQCRQECVQQCRLKQHVLSPIETLAQSVSTIAPSTSPTLTVPVVFALAGDGTWLAYLLALAALVLVALTIAAFARDSASPGSLYIYTRSTLPPSFAALAAYALFFAYVATISSMVGGFTSYAYVLLGRLGTHLPLLLLGALVLAAALWLAVLDVKLSARTMLWVEALSVCLIGCILALVLWKHGPHLDTSQFRLRGFPAGGLRLGMMMALFSFVGFESATTLGTEAIEPLKTIPRAVVRSAILAGGFFLLCAYGEVLGFRGQSTSLGVSTAPMLFLATHAGVGILGPVINLGVLLSIFAAMLSCVIAAARVLMLMAHHGMVPASLSRTHPTRETPGAASLLAGALAFVPVTILAVSGVSGPDIYGWMGTLAVYGFLTSYALVAIALPLHLKRHARLGPGGMALSLGATTAMLAALAGTVYPVPPAPYRYLPYIYATYLALGMLWYAASPRRRALGV